MICHLLITFAKRLHQDQTRQNIGPDLNQSESLLFDTRIAFLKELTKIPVGQYGLKALY